MFCNQCEETGRELTTGCAHQAVDAIAGSGVDAIRGGAIRRFVVMAGCDGRQPEREYYREFAPAPPRDTGILDVLVREFGLKTIATVGEDLARMVPAAAGG